MNRFFYQIFSMLVIGFFCAAPAFSGDRALLDVIGYSKDARYFAFEEFGIQDGSGFAYSSIYIVDLSDDSWVTGTPIKVLEEYDEATYEVEPIDTGKSINIVRQLSSQKAKPRIDGLSIYRPAHELAQNGDGAVTNEEIGLSLKFGLPAYGLNAIVGEYEISLDIFKTHSALSCVDYAGEEPMGFLVKLKDENQEVKIVYEDEVLARSRGCPITYKIHSVYVPFEAVDISSAVALISVYAFGYEGADRRFVAIPIGNN